MRPPWRVKRATAANVRANLLDRLFNNSYVLAGEARIGPMPFEDAVKLAYALEHKGMPLSDLQIVSCVKTSAWRPCVQ